jgi:hypothetical protein
MKPVCLSKHHILLLVLPVFLHYKYLLVSVTEISDIHISSCSHESMALPEKVSVTYKCIIIEYTTAVFLVRGNMFLSNAGNSIYDYMASQPKRPQSISSLT